MSQQQVLIGVLSVILLGMAGVVAIQASTPRHSEDDNPEKELFQEELIGILNGYYIFAFEYKDHSYIGRPDALIHAAHCKGNHPNSEN